MPIQSVGYAPVGILSTIKIHLLLHLYSPGAISGYRLVNDCVPEQGERRQNWRKAKERPVMMNGTTRAGGPFRNRKMTSLYFGLRENEAGDVASRHRVNVQRNSPFWFADYRVCRSRVSRCLLFHSERFLCPPSHSLLPSATNVRRRSVHFRVGWGRPVIESEVMGPVAAGRTGYAARS